jgi:hypothetical protein
MSVDGIKDVNMRLDHRHRHLAFEDMRAFLRQRKAARTGRVDNWRRFLGLELQSVRAGRARVGTLCDGTGGKCEGCNQRNEFHEMTFQLGRITQH